MWAWLDDNVSANEFTARNLKKSADLRERLTAEQRRTESLQSDVDEIRALMDRPPVKDEPSAT